MAPRCLFILAALAAAVLAVPSDLNVERAVPKQRVAPSPGHWVDTWVSMPQLTESTNLPNPPFNGTTGVFRNTTIRQTVHTSIGGNQIRIRISNAFGATSLPITAVTVALPAGGAAGVSAIEPNTLQQVTFSGNTSFTLPDAGLAVSDPLNFKVEPQSMLTITMFLAQGQDGFDISSHPGSRTTTFFSFGNQVSAANISDASTQSVAHWYFISAVEVWAPTTTSGFAIIGDSITDGRGSTDNMNNRWPDQLLARMQNNPDTANIAVLNQAAGGNRILLDGLGPAAVGRVERDVLAQSGIKFAMIFEGVNDIGTTAPTQAAQEQVGDQLIWAFKQMAMRIHTFGIPFFGATITPFGSPDNSQAYSSPVRDAQRNRINDFIRNSGVFDGVIDFDLAVRDPNNATQLNPAFNSGDFLHLNPAGYQAMAAAVPLELFSQFANGVDSFN